jgi:hypothetical protein
MKSQTRQTLIGVTGLTAVMIVALLQGFNGEVTAVYFAAVVALVSPEALDRLKLASGGK